jgi:hypothetical protein
MLSEDTRFLIAGLWDVFWTQLRLMLPWTRRAAMAHAITMVAEDHDMTPVQAFALMYDRASPAEQVRLAPYRPARDPGPDEEEVSWDDPA